MLSADNDTFTPSYPIWIPFIYFSSLIAVARTFINMLSNSGEGGQSYLLHDLRGIAFCFSTLRIMFAVGLQYMVFTMLREVPSMPIFLKTI